MIFFMYNNILKKKTMTDTWRQDNRGRSLTIKSEIALL
jgi:hypothetical protein